MLIEPPGRSIAHQRLPALITMTLLTLPASVLAGPQVIEETAKIAKPDPAYTSFPVSVAIDGDWLIAAGRRDDFETGTMVRSSAWLYQRQSNGQWTLVRRGRHQQLVRTCSTLS